MGVDVRWFNHDKREYVDPADLPANNRWGYGRGYTSDAFYALMRDHWNGNRVEMHADTGDEFFDLPRAGYRNATAELRSWLEHIEVRADGMHPDDLHRLRDDLEGTRAALMDFLNDPSKAEQARQFVAQLDAKLAPLAEQG